MATISFRAQPPSNFLVDNPVMFDLFSDAQALIAFDVAVDGAPAYEGVFMPVGNAPTFEANIAVQDILQPFFTQAPALVSPDAIVSEVERMYVDFTIRFHADGEGMLTHTARAYRGGISKELLRRLSEEGLDVFDYRLMNTQQQFFLTTRTHSNRITMRRDELAPLCFIATGKTHRVTTDTGETYLFPATEPGKVYAFNIEAFINSLPEPPHRLSIPLFLNQYITIDLVDVARVPERIVLEFANSYGVPERLEVSGLASCNPEVSDESYNVYDLNVDDYIERNERQSRREIIKAQTGYKTLDECLFLHDLLQSERLYLIDADGVARRQIRVKAEDFSHAAHPFQPESVMLTIRFVDSDTRFSPEFYENPVLENLFIATLNFSAANMNIALPFSGNVNLTVDWGDGTEQAVTTDYARHTYAAEGVYTIQVLGHTDTMYVSLSSAAPAGILQWRNSLIAIEKWGDLGFQSLEGASQGCTNLAQVERYVSFKNATTAASMFNQCSSLTHTFTRFDAPLLTTAVGMYNRCSSLEEVSESLFSKCSELQNIASMFYQCPSLVNVPVYLFANNTKLKEAQQCFSYCTKLRNAPSFYYNRNIDNFYAIFSSCSALQEVPDYCFYKASATNMPSVFFQCNSLSTVPAHIFAGCTEMLAFDNTFDTAGLIEAPEDLFRDCTKVTSFNYTFYKSTLTAVPADLFRYNTQVTSFLQTLAICTALTAVPADLFRYNTQVTSFDSTLAGCTALTTVPADLFRYNTQVTSFPYTLNGCHALTTVPADLFRYNTQVTSFEGTIRVCNKLNSIPADLFRYNTQATSFLQTLAYNNSLATVPADLFRYNTQVTIFDQTFCYCPLFTPPAGLFRYNTEVLAFQQTFLKCRVTDIPEDLFRYNTKVVAFNNTFDGCQMKTLPDTLFQYNTEAYYLAETFIRSSLTDIPADLFKWIKNDASVSLEGCFSQTQITSIPENLFASLTEITSIRSTFRACSLLTTIPSDLLKYNILLTSVNGLFGGCVLLTTIPSDLLKYNIHLTSVNGLFGDCIRLTTIPESLFSNCPDLQSVSYTFSDNSGKYLGKLTAIPNLLFDNNKKITNLSGCFYYQNSLTGSTPSGSDGVKLWERAGKPGYPATVSGTSCFNTCYGLDDYNDIPSNWK
jgi:hypothetical protein